MSSRTIGSADGLAQLSFAVHGMLEKRAGARDLSIVQTRLLGILRDRRPTMNELARLLDLDKSSVTGLVTRAERRGLVERAPSPADRRVTLVELTADGRALAAEVTTEFAGDVNALLGHLPEAEQASLAALVSRLMIAHAGAHGVDLFSTQELG